MIIIALLVIRGLSLNLLEIEQVLVGIDLIVSLCHLSTLLVNFI